MAAPGGFKPPHLTVKASCLISWLQGNNSYLPFFAVCHRCSGEEPASPIHKVGIRSTLPLSSVAYYVFIGGIHKPRVKHHLAMKVIFNALPRRSPLVRVRCRSLVSGRSVPVKPGFSLLFAAFTAVGRKQLNPLTFNRSIPVELILHVNSAKTVWSIWQEKYPCPT